MKTKIGTTEAKTLERANAMMEAAKDAGFIAEVCHRTDFEVEFYQVHVYLDGELTKSQLLAAIDVLDTAWKPFYIF